MGRVVCDPSAATSVTSEGRGSTTWPFRKRGSGRTLNGDQTDYARLAAFDVDIFQEEICDL